jgi:ubiquinone/menaquinone biosynthesis C-methylase UbiE
LNKELQWEGYYDPYFKKAVEKAVNPLDILNQEWYNGKRTAEECVLPYISNNSVVLEIACGIGRVSKYVASNCKNLFCTDILEAALKEAKNNLKSFDNVFFDKINGYDLSSFKENYFDCVYSFTAFFHFDFELVVNYFSEIKRVLKPEGIAIIEFKRWKSKVDVVELLDKIKKIGGLEEYEKELDKWRYVSVEMLEILCEYFGLEIIDNDVTQFKIRKLN